jgi:3-oxoacyl-[acyl-carrier protein] reductase
MDLGLANRTYIVTGATRGIGRAIAEALVAEGARVVISGRSAEAVSAAVADLGADRAVGVVADNADPSTPAVLLAAAERLGQCHGLAVSVGGPPPGTLLDSTDESWRTGIESILMGAVRLLRQITPKLGPDGSVLLVLSGSVRQPLNGLAISNGLRPGLAMLAKNLADEVGPAGVRVNSLLPGRIDTDRVRELDALAPDPAAHRAAAEETIPLRRYGQPAEAGRVGAFLLSPAASYVTGAAIPVDGGLLRGT